MFYTQADLPLRKRSFAEKLILKDGTLKLQELCGFPVWFTDSLDKVSNLYSFVDLDLEYPMLDLKAPTSGCADSIAQYLNKYGQLIKDSNDTFILIYTILDKHTDLSWDELGYYMGTKERQHDYLRDERSEFDSVTLWTLYQVK